MNPYGPERDLIKSDFKKLNQLVRANKNEEIVSCKVIKCNKDLSLEVEIGEYQGHIPADEVQASCIRNTQYKVIKLVGHFIKCVITDIKSDEDGVVVTLSRAKAQQMCIDEYLSKLEIGDVIRASVDGIVNYGVYCDIGCGITSLLPISNICTIPILNMKTFFGNTKNIYVAIKDIDREKKRFVLTHKELLGTWEDEINDICAGETLTGTIINNTDYGVFISIGQNLKGIADLEEPFDNLSKGTKVSVFIKGINKEKKKIRLKIISVQESQESQAIKFKYYVTSGKISF